MYYTNTNLTWPAFPSEDANHNANGEDVNGEVEDARVCDSIQDTLYVTMENTEMGPCEGVQENSANGADGNSVYEHIIMLWTMYYTDTNLTWPAFPSEDANHNANGEDANGEDANGEVEDARVSDSIQDSTVDSSEGHFRTLTLRTVCVYDCDLTEPPVRRRRHRR